jgi:hypothetical protein
MTTDIKKRELAAVRQDYEFCEKLTFSFRKKFIFNEK